MINVCKEEGVSPGQVFFAFLCCWLCCYEISQHKFFVCERQLMKILSVILSGDQEKNHVEFFDTGILRV